MKRQLSKPARARASYAEEYKSEALELWRASGRSPAKIATELGIRPPLLYRWAHLERQQSTSKSESKPVRRIAELEAEIRRLRAETLNF
jgi:transposase-like protein